MAKRLPSDPTEWLMQVFDAQQVSKGGVVRRQKVSVHKLASQTQLVEMVRRLGFHLIETGSQYVVICNKGVLRIHC